MKYTVLFFILSAAVLTTTVSAQTISGRVVDKNGTGIADASVSLKIKGLAGTTDATGVFSLNGASIQTPYSSRNRQHTLLLQGHNLVVNNASPQLLRVELFDMSGKRCGALFNRRFDKGSHTFRIASFFSGFHADGLFIIRITNGSDACTVPFNSLEHTGGSSLQPATSQNDNHFMAKKLATPDTLTVV